MVFLSILSGFGGTVFFSSFHFSVQFFPRLISLFRDMINRIEYFQTMNPSSFRSQEHKATLRTDVAIGCLCQVAMLKLAREQHRREVCNARLQVTVCI